MVGDDPINMPFVPHHLARKVTAIATQKKKGGKKERKRCTSKQNTIHQQQKLTLLKVTLTSWMKILKLTVKIANA